MVVPAAEAAPLEVVEPKLALHLLVDGLRSPALLERAHDLLGRHRARQRRERVLRRLLLTFGPLDEQPERLARCRLGAVVMPDLHAPKREVGAELAPRSLAPGDAAKRPSTERQSKGARALPLGTPAVGPIDEPHRCRRVDAQSV